MNYRSCPPTLPKYVSIGSALAGAAAAEMTFLMGLSEITGEGSSLQHLRTSPLVCPPNDYLFMREYSSVCLYLFVPIVSSNNHKSYLPIGGW
jgi:hypothetical protein